MGNKKTANQVIEGSDKFLTFNGNGATPPHLRLGDLIDEIAGTLRRYIDFEKPELAIVATLWIVQALLFELFHYCGYLALRSATPRCGKTRLLKLIALYLGVIVTAIPTSAVIFRTERKILLLDEVDQLQNKDKELFGTVLSVLNCGFERGAVIERCEKGKGGFTVQQYPVYGPKALSGIEGLADTLADRCFPIRMKRTGKTLPRLNLRRMQDRAEEVRTQILQWGEQRAEEITEVYEKLPDEVSALRGLDDRLQDISEPLVILATLADQEREGTGGLLASFLIGLKYCAGRREPSGREQAILEMLEILDDELSGRDHWFISTSRLLEFCGTCEDLSWIETGRRLSNFLKPFDLFVTRNSDRTQRGYLVTREWIDEWRKSYPQPQEEEMEVIHS